MSKFVGAVLLDTRSIQKYVFYSNELKTNVGSSYIVDKIFTDLMCAKILPKMQAEGVLGKINTSWKQNKAINMLTDANLNCEVVYVGGGNMLLLVRAVAGDSKDAAEKALPLCQEIVKRWSKELLLCAPGLKTGAAIGVLDIEIDNYTELVNKLYASLKDNQNNIIPNVDLPYTGLTKECDVSGKAADTYDNSTSKGKRMVASEVKAKIDAYSYAADELRAAYGDILNDEYDFADELEKIGYKSGESYLAVIHIDGNNMGAKFSGCATLQKRKELSMSVSAIVDKAFMNFLKDIVAEYGSYEQYLDKKVMQKGGQKLLPLRPIIIGGDDITFVCPGRLGITYAKRFIEYAAAEGLDCCGGVAIVPARYPFFRAYDLAEQVCGAAKLKARKDDNKSWMDFIILHGEMSPELEQLREQQYVGAIGQNLHYGPYKVGKAYNGNDSIDALLKLEAMLNSDAKQYSKLGNEEKKEARNKIKKLREVLNQDMHAQERFLDLADVLRAMLADINNKAETDVTAKDLWEGSGANARTRYIDAIEIMDFCPIVKA